MHALDLPEIWSLIVNYLSRGDLAASVRVCKAWKASVLPLLWSHITLFSNATHGQHALSTHAHLIKKLEFVHYTIPVGEPITVSPLTALTSLKVTMSSNSAGPADMQLYEDVTSRASILRDALVDVCRTKRDFSSLMRAIKNCSCLRILHLRRIIPSKEVMDIFLEACQGLDDLTLSLVEFDAQDQSLWPSDAIGSSTTTGATTTSATIPRLGSLTVLAARTATHYDPLPNAMARFTGIQRLQFEVESPDKTAFIGFVRLVSAGTWPHLHSLTLNTYLRGPSDTDLATVIGAMRTCTKLCFQRVTMGPLAMEQMLTRHNETLECLIAGGIEEVEVTKKDWAVDLMQNCPNLTVLEVDRLNVGRLLNGGLWKCLGLTTFRVAPLLKDTGQDFLEMQRVLFDQLWRLSKLRQVEFNVTSGGIAGHVRLLDLRLGRGLEMLAGWTMLEHFSFQNTLQESTMEDVEWMLKHWKRLHTLRGNLSQKKATQSVIAAYVRERGVSYLEEKYV